MTPVITVVVVEPRVGDDVSSVVCVIGKRSRALLRRGSMPQSAIAVVIKRANLALD
jgi:hypothetical protein